MTQQELNELYFTRCVMCRVIEQAWEDALNVKKYKSDYVNEETQKNREQAREWFAGEEFERWGEALGQDVDLYREHLKHKISLTNQAE
jgi:hypothetical protein